MMRGAGASSAAGDVGTLLLRAKRLARLCMRVLLHAAPQPLPSLRDARARPASGSPLGAPETAVAAVELLTGVASIIPCAVSLLHVLSTKKILLFDVHPLETHFSHAPRPAQCSSS